MFYCPHPTEQKTATQRNVWSHTTRIVGEARIQTQAPDWFFDTKRGELGYVLHVKVKTNKQTRLPIPRREVKKINKNAKNTNENKRQICFPIISLSLALL